MSPIPMKTTNDERSSLSPEIMNAIYGTVDDKKKAYEESLKRWWTEYADRKNDEDDEYVANSLLYDRNHLPRSAPAPDCCLGSDERPVETLKDESGSSAENSK